MGKLELVRNPEIEIEKLNQIGYDALMEVTGRYGTGDAEIDSEYQPELKSLAYHNMSHTMRVRDAARRLAQANGLNTYDEELAVTIASAHDIFHHTNDPNQTDEELSAEWLQDALAAKGLPAEDQTIARLAILGTTPITDAEGNFIEQQFTRTSFPNERASTVALVVAAADMESLFAPYSAMVAHDLFKEQQGCATTDTVTDLSGLIPFQTKQIKFLTDYKPLQPGLEYFFGDLRREIIQYHTLLRDAVAAGQITSWNEITELDTRFCQEFTEQV